MMLKKIFAGLSAGIIAICGLMPLSISAVNSDYPIGDLEPSVSEIKPVIVVDTIELTPEEAAAQPLQKVSIKLTGADKKYSAFGFHINYDLRLALTLGDDGKYVSRGKAASAMGFIYSRNDDGLLFTGASGAKDSGRNGVLMTMLFRVPDNAEVGDVYPINIEYHSDKKTADCFSNIPEDETSALMEAWAFTYGTRNGCIKIVANHDDTVTYGDANCDGDVNMSDAVLIMQSIANGDEYGLGKPDGITEKGMNNGDVYDRGDGLTLYDALSIQRLTLELIESLPESWANPTT